MLFSQRQIDVSLTPIILPTNLIQRKNSNNSCSFIRSRSFANAFLFWTQYFCTIPFKSSSFSCSNSNKSLNELQNKKDIDASTEKKISLLKVKIAKLRAKADKAESKRTYHDERIAAKEYKAALKESSDISFILDDCEVLIEECQNVLKDISKAEEDFSKKEEKSVETPVSKLEKCGNTGKLIASCLDLDKAGHGECKAASSVEGKAILSRIQELVMSDKTDMKKLHELVNRFAKVNEFYNKK